LGLDGAAEAEREKECKHAHGKGLPD